MDYEKAYKEVLNRARKELDACVSQDCDAARQIFRFFPELKESEDERIRKALIELVRMVDKAPIGQIFGYGDIKYSDMIAWLEKQESVREIVERCKTSWYNEGKIAGMAEGLSDEEKYQQGWHDALEKQGESKPFDYESANIQQKDFAPINVTDEEIVEAVKDTSVLDMVEPKFKVKDWISNGRHTRKIVGLHNDNRHYMFEDGSSIRVSNIDRKYHLWTIADSKNGDVLATDDGNICIFDGTVEDGKYPFAYCGFTRYGFESYNRKLPFTHNNVYPAIKEQRDLLFQKMKEAGYEWDAEKKELTHIDARENLTLDGDLMEADCMIVEQKPQRMISAEAKEAMYDKPSWSEEDEEFLRRAINAAKDAYSMTAKWLKLLKDRIK